MFAERVTGVALLGTSSGNMDQALLGLPGPVARAAHRLTPLVAPTLVSRGDLIESTRQRTSDLSKIILSQYSFGSSVPAEIADFTADMINATPVDVVGEFRRRSMPTTSVPRWPRCTGSRCSSCGGQGRQDDTAGTLLRDHPAVPHAELVVLPDTGHMLMLERADEVSGELIELWRGAHGAQQGMATRTSEHAPGRCGRPRA